MSDAESLSSDDIAFLCDIGAFELTEGRHPAQLQRLIAAGYVEPANAAQAPAKFQLTAKAERLLSALEPKMSEAEMRAASSILKGMEARGIAPIVAKLPDLQKE